jgi:hypothetical protein
MGCTQRCSSGELSERPMTLAHVLLTGLDLALPEIYLPLGSQTLLPSFARLKMLVRRQTDHGLLQLLLVRVQLLHYITLVKKSIYRLTD